MHCPAVSHAGITVCPVIHWYSFTCIWAVNIRCSPQITHKCCTPPRPCLGHVTAAKYWTQVRKDPGGQYRIGRDIVRSRIDVQLSNVSWNHKRRDSVNVRLAADLKNWHFTGQHVHRGWVVYLSTKHQSSASSGYSLCHYFTINEKKIHSRTYRANAGTGSRVKTRIEHNENGDINNPCSFMLRRSH